MASAEDIRELQSKLDALVKRRFGAGSWDAAFKAYDRDADGLINASELDALLEAADVGNGFTRGMWADGVITEVDRDGDGRISLNELRDVVDSRGKGVAPVATTATTRPDYLYPIEYPANFTPKNPNPVAAPKPKPKPKPADDSFALWALAAVAAWFLMRGGR
jgi:hypothetical protein